MKTAAEVLWELLVAELVVFNKFVFDGCRTQDGSVESCLSSTFNNVVVPGDSRDLRVAFAFCNWFDCA
jgi:hypothetical protein